MCLSSGCRSPSTGHVDVLLGMESLLPAGAKKIPKIYQIACHPLQPHLVVAGANAGVQAWSSLPLWHGARHEHPAGLMLLCTMWRGVKYALVGPLRQQSLPECECLVCEPPIGPVGMHMPAALQGIPHCLFHTSSTRQCILALENGCELACCNVLPIDTLLCW